MTFGIMNVHAGHPVQEIEQMNDSNVSKQFHTGFDGPELIVFPSPAVVGLIHINNFRLKSAN